MRGSQFNGLLLGAAAIAAAPEAFAAEPAFHQDHVLGTSLDILVSGRGSAIAIAAARREIARLDEIFSLWRPDSELSALNASTRFRASPELFAVIREAERYRALTGGAFSPRLAGAMRVWRDPGTDDEARPHLARAAARDAQAAQLSLDRRTRTIEKPSALAFDLDGIAKGYVLDRALRAARRARPEAEGMLIDIGGDIAAWGAPRGAEAWAVGIAPATHDADNLAPRAALLLHNQALAVTGRGSRDLQIAGQRHASLLSSRDGALSAHAAQVAVVAPTALQADALSTAMSLMPEDHAIALADAMPGVATSIVTNDQTVVENGRWRMFSMPCQAPVAPAWPNGFALDVAFQILRPGTGGYERPYVAIWISDEQRRLVRTLLILGDSPRWRESNYIFWRRFERLNPDPIQRLAKPTRAPGQYHVAWDGRDESGRPAPQGAYTLNIEASRERGAHDFHAIALDLRDGAFSTSVQAKTELGAASVKYGRR